MDELHDIQNLQVLNFDNKGDEEHDSKKRQNKANMLMMNAVMMKIVMMNAGIEEEGEGNN